jgi:hypothetical protein
MSFGRGGFVCKSSKQKLNAKSSSTEAEVMGAINYLPNKLWVKMFMEAQGHAIMDSFLGQRKCDQDGEERKVLRGAKVKAH